MTHGRIAMQSDQPLTFQSVFSAIGQKLDSDAELRQLFSQALMLCLGETPEASPQPLEAPAQSLESTEEPSETLALEKAPEEIKGAEPVPASAPQPRPTPVELAALVQAFKTLPSLPPSELPATRSGGPAPLKTIQARLQIKQDAIAQALERGEAKSRGENVHSTGQWFSSVISQAKALPNCYLWMCQARHDSVQPDTWRETATSFRVLARALSIVAEVQQIDAGRHMLERSLLLLAEAQSAVRKACMVFDFEDGDQVDVYLHLLSWSAAEQLYIGRFMKADDLADPNKSHEVLGRIDSLALDLTNVTAERKVRGNLFGKIRYELKMLANNPPAPLPHWTKIIASVDQLVSIGLAPNNVELRSLLIPHLDSMPESEQAPDGFKRFMSAVDVYLATQPSPTLSAESTPTPEVQQVAGFLSGTAMVMIGGECRHESRMALIRAFGLSDLNWIETRAHETVGQFESAVAREDVKLVLLAIRWSSHSYGEVKKFCDKYGKKLVRLPRGYGVNQVAAEICNQCSEEFG